MLHCVVLLVLAVLGAESAKNAEVAVAVAVTAGGVRGSEFGSRAWAPPAAALPVPAARGCDSCSTELSF